MKRPALSLLALAALLVATPAAADDAVRIKDLGHFQGWRDNPLVGYGLVVGLSGSGDTARNMVSQQALRNVLSRLGAQVTNDQLQSRNVAAVIVTATLPPSAHIGDRLDATVSSIGDARSLAGGSLLMTPLAGPDQKTYALAQGQVVVGGYSFESNQNLQQKNYPTAGALPRGASVETPVSADLLGSRGALSFVLANPDATTATRIAQGIDQALGSSSAVVRDASEIEIRPAAQQNLTELIARIENVAVVPADLARIVVSERSGTVVAGGAVRISAVTVSKGDITVSVTAANEAYQPFFVGQAGDGVRSLIVTNTKLSANEDADDAVIQFPSTTVADLVTGLQRAHVNTRGMIDILQAIKAAGALHADLIVE